MDDEGSCPKIRHEISWLAKDHKSHSGWSKKNRLSEIGKKMSCFQSTNLQSKT